MKVFPYLLTLAFAIVCLTCWVLSELVLRSLADTHRDYLLSAFTAFVIRPNWWILACPVPWLIYSVVLTMRRELNPAAVFVFAGTLFLAAAVLVCAVVFASVLPFIPLAM